MAMLEILGWKVHVTNLGRNKKGTLYEVSGRDAARFHSFCQEQNLEPGEMINGDFLINDHLMLDGMASSVEIMQIYEGLSGKRDPITILGCKVNVGVQGTGTALKYTVFGPDQAKLKAVFVEQGITTSDSANTFSVLREELAKAKRGSPASILRSQIELAAEPSIATRV